MSVGVGSHQIKTKLEMLVNLGGEGVGISLIGIAEGNDCRVIAGLGSVNRSGDIYIGFTHRKQSSLLLESDVPEIDVVESLAEESVESYLPSSLKLLVETDVRTEYLRILEVLGKGIDGLACA